MSNSTETHTNNEEKLDENLVTLLFFAFIVLYSIIILIIATIIAIFRPRWFKQNIYGENDFQMSDCSCLTACFPCTSCSFRQFLRECCPKINFRQRSFDFTKCFQRPTAPHNFDLVCCTL